MKKIIAILLSLALLLGCVSAVAEEKTNFGIIRANGVYTLKGTVPEGYKAVPFELSDDAILWFLNHDDPALPEMILSIGFDESYSGVDRLNDMDEEGLEALEKTFTVTDPYANITYDETEHGTRLLICRTVSDYNDYLLILSIYNGYFIELGMTPGEKAAEQKLTDEDLNTCIKFLSDLDFVSGEIQEELKTAGETFDALITAFDAEAKTLDVTLLKPVRLTEWQAVSINEGDTMTIGQGDVFIYTLAYEGDDAIINDEYYLTKNDDGYYTVKFYEFPILEEVKTLTVNVPDTLAFLEGVDPESGEMLEEAKTLTAADLFAALTASQQGGVGFDAQNVRITFDEKDEPAQIERYYTPWQ